MAHSLGDDTQTLYRVEYDLDNLAIRMSGNQFTIIGPSLPRVQAKFLPHGGENVWLVVQVEWSSNTWY